MHDPVASVPSSGGRLMPGLILLALLSGIPAGGAPTMEHVVLHRDDTQHYLGLSLCLLPSGDILMSLREAHARPLANSHMDPTSRGVMLRSRDVGRTFGDKRLIDDRTHRFSATQDPTLTALSDGSLLASFYSWGIAPQRGDGRVVTAYYARRVENHERYHMGVAIWSLPPAAQ